MNDAEQIKRTTPPSSAVRVSRGLAGLLGRMQPQPLNDDERAALVWLEANAAAGEDVEAA